MSKRYQVIIVGGGPVGLALAVTLGMRGIACLLLERRVTQARIPKGQNLTHRTLEHFYFWGIADALRAARVMPKDYPIGEVTAYGNLMSEWWQAPPGREVVRKFYFQANERLPQYQMEAVLKQKLAALPSVDLRFGWTATRVEQDNEKVWVTAAGNGGASEIIEADYVVGCDGGHSLVREQVGITRGGTDFDQLMMLAVFRSRELHERLKRFPGRSTYRVMHPDYNGYWQFFGRIDVGEGWFFHCPVPAGTSKENCDFLGLIRRAAGFDFNAEFDHVGFWDLRVAVAEKYQVGRVFIAGDAAHSHPPYGGFGLNNGLEDAVNLGWKLAARLQGWGGEALLESYSEERRPIFHEVAEDFIAKRIRNDAEFLRRYDPQRNRAEFESAWNARASELGQRAQVYEPRYEGSPIVVGPPGGRSSAHGEHMLKARAGHHLAPQVLSSGRNVFEELGKGYTLLAFGAGATDAFEQAAQARHIPLKVVRDTCAEGRALYDARMILVRPDQYIVWAGDATPDNPGVLMDRAAGWSVLPG
jgi:2-polyprenyl-6-methoxyphenol hydroxylase-like FAD-dependent oxidoreductase